MTCQSSDFQMNCIYKINLPTFYVLIIVGAMFFGFSNICLAQGEKYYIGKEYSISETTKSIYPKESNAKRYKICNGIKKWLEGGDVDIRYIEPAYSGKSLTEKGFQKFFPKCDIRKYEKSADMSPHRAENAEGKEEVYWTTSGDYYESRYFEVYMNGIHVLYTGPAYSTKKNSDVVRGGGFIVFKPESCETGGVAAEYRPSLLVKGERGSLSKIIRYLNDYYILRVEKENEKSIANITIFSIVKNQLGIVCSLDQKK